MSSFLLHHFFVAHISKYDQNFEGGVGNYYIKIWKRGYNSMHKIDQTHLLNTSFPMKTWFFWVGFDVPSHEVP